MKKIYLFIFTVFIFSSPSILAQGPCSGTPAANAALASSTVMCSGSTLTLSLQNSYATSGITIQWVYSSVSSGPFTNISGATNTVQISNSLPGTGYYTAIITCANGNGSVMATPVFVTIQAPGQTTTVPYYEDFEGIKQTNELPNCSWAASNLGGTCLTFTSPSSGGAVPCSGQKFAAFTATPASTNAFFTNGLQLTAGVIYSASIWFHTGSTTNQNWSNLSLLINSSQNSTGASTVSSAAHPIVGITCKNLSGTFSVATSGDYYLGISATSTVSANSSHLYFDDVSVTIPCTGPGAPNSPTISVLLSSNTVCAGQAITATITGAHMYNPPLTNSVLTFSLNVSALLSSSGTNTLTGCISTKSIAVNVSPNPSGFIVASSLIVCAGFNNSLTAGSANDLVVWSTGQTGTLIVVSPTITTPYTLTVTNQYGCSATASTTINVNPLPQVGIIATKTLLCVGDEVMLSGTGAFKFSWVGHSALNSVSVSPSVNTTYSLIGMSQDGCFDTTTVELVVMECVGINKLNSQSGDVYFYPNPVSSEFILVGVTEEFQVFIYDQHGKLVLEMRGTSGSAIDVSNLSNGIYTANVKSETGEKKLKLIKK